MASTFRAAYYQKIGFQGVEVQVSLDKLLRAETVDVHALARLTLKSRIPQAQRKAVWRLLLGITPPCREAVAVVQEQMAEQFEDVSRATSCIWPDLRDAAPIPPGMLLPGEEEEAVEEAPVGPLASKRLAMMYRLSSSGAQAYNCSQAEVAESAAIADHFFGLCNHEVSEAFWLYSAFMQIVEVNFMDGGMYRRMFDFVRLENLELWQHVAKFRVRVNAEVQARWLRQCFATILQPSFVVGVWDLIVAGSPMFALFVGLSLLVTYAEALLGLFGQAIDDFLKNPPCASSQDESQQVWDTAKTLWAKYGSPVKEQRGGPS